MEKKITEVKLRPLRWRMGQRDVKWQTCTENGINRRKYTITRAYNPCVPNESDKRVMWLE